MSLTPYSPMRTEVDYVSFSFTAELRPPAKHTLVLQVSTLREPSDHEGGSAQ